MTYLLELVNSIRQNCKKDIEIVECHYTADGIQAEIKDVGLDGQKYILTLEPKKGGTK